MNPPSASSPQGVACVACNGKGCTACGGRGYDWLTECPFTVCREVWPVVNLAKLAEDGAWPEPGGVLDQSHSFVEFMQTYRAAVSRANDDNQDQRTRPAGNA